MSDKITLPTIDSVYAPEGSFGPTFRSELTAAGVGELPFVVQTMNVVFGASISPADRAKVMAVIQAHDPTKTLNAIAPDCQSLPWWRTALKLWTRTDSTGAVVSRFSDIDLAIKALEGATNSDGSPNTALQRQGILAREQFEYASSVVRDDLMKLAPAFGFSPSDVDESLWRADQVRQGDLSGVWPK